MKHVISTTTAPGAVVPYSQAIEANGFVFVSGQLPLDPATGAFVPGGTSEQAEQSIKNLLAVLEAAGCKAEDVVKTTVFMIDIGDFGVVNEVYGKYFSGECPARCAMQAAACSIRISLAAAGAAGCAGGCGVYSPMATWISLGISISTGPGRPEAANEKASRMVSASSSIEPTK